jgi:hypothetical protein
MGEHSSETPCYTWRRKSKREVRIVCTFLVMPSEGGCGVHGGCYIRRGGHEHSSLSHIYSKEPCFPAAILLLFKKKIYGIIDEGKTNRLIPFMTHMDESFPILDVIYT